MTLGIRGKLFLISFAILLVVGSASGVFLEMRLRPWLERQLQDELRRHAGAARILLEQAPSLARIEEADALANRIGNATDARVTVIRLDGKVIGDSSQTIQELAVLENHGHRPEILAALTDGFGVTRRPSTTVHAPLLYVAVPFQGSDTSGTVRLATPLEEVEATIAHVRLLVLGAGLFGLALAALMTGLAAHYQARTLRLLLFRARKLTEGEKTDRIPLTSGDELSGLAGTLNTLAEELESTVAVLGTERNLFHAVLEGMSEGMVVVDEERRISVFNRAAVTLFRLTGSPEGRPLIEVVRIPVLADLAERALQGMPSSIEFDLIGPVPRKLLGRAAPLSNPPGAVMVFHDVTDLRRLEIIRKDFVANVSHELRTPVSIIRANAETLLDGAMEDRERALQFLEAIHRNAGRLSQLVADLLDLSRIESGRQRLDLQAVPLGVAAQRALEAFRTGAEGKELVLTSQVPPDLMVRADSRALDQVLLNLVDNAVKYSLKKGSVEITAASIGDKVRVEVRDDGPGIEPQHRPRLFERFYRVDTGRSRDMGGTGLGLAIVKHLVEAMGGSIGMEPGKPKGSVFWFTVPVPPLPGRSNPKEEQ